MTDQITIDEMPAETPSVITPGNHDGVHLGHRALIDTARAYASDRGLSVVALTFDPHPAQILFPHKVPPLITTIGRRAELLRGAGADHVVVQKFGSEFASLSPDRFMKKWLIESLHARALVVGQDFGFGNNRSGNIETLLELGGKYGFDVIVVQPVTRCGKVVSSSAIREAITNGDLKQATLFLDRVHEVTGEVVVGDRRGRSLGYPTANLRCAELLLPPNGVYAVVARKLAPESNERLFGVANIGERPTFGAGHSVEVHLLDFDQPLYGSQLRIGFVERIRGERSFQHADQLCDQIRRDIEEAQQVFLKTDKGRWSWL